VVVGRSVVKPVGGKDTVGDCLTLIGKTFGCRYGGCAANGPSLASGNSANPK
jgi:hypothetical protein